MVFGTLKLTALVGSLVIAAPLIKDQILFGRVTEEDRKIKKLIKDGLFFDVPFFTWNKNNHRMGVAAYGKEIGLPVEARLTNHRVIITLEDRVTAIQSEDNDSLSELRFDRETKGEIDYYCTETLKKMSKLSFLSLMIGFKPASQKIMINSAFTAPRQFTPLQQQMAEQRVIRYCEMKDKKT